MSDPTPPVHTARPSAVLIPPDPTPETGAARRRANADRVPDRVPDRAPSRRKSIQPETRYAVAPQDMPRGMDGLWAAETIRGMPNPRFTEFLRQGYRPAKAQDFPIQSGYDVWGNNPELTDTLSEFVKPVKAEDPVRDRGLILLVRPQELSNEARAEEREQAKSQIEDHMDRLYARSKAEVPNATRMSRKFRPANYAPDDGGDEE